jgi:hypothetical protein
MVWLPDVLTMVLMHIIPEHGRRTYGLDEYGTSLRRHACGLGNGCHYCVRSHYYQLTTPYILIQSPDHSSVVHCIVRIGISQMYLAAPFGTSTRISFHALSQLASLGFPSSLLWFSLRRSVFCSFALRMILKDAPYSQTVQKPAQQLPYKQSKLGVLEETTTGQYGTMGTNQAPGDLLSSQQPTYRDSTSPSRRQANISGDTLVEPQDNGVVPFRQLLTGPVLLSIANYGMLAILDISLGALQPLFFSTPIEFGGLGFSPARIGLVLGLFGILNGIFQGIFFARIVNWWGLRRTFMISMLSFVFIFALFPVISTLARKYGVGTEVWIAIVVQLLFWVIMDMAYGERHSVIYQ